jgi:hypothetical protein
MKRIYFLVPLLTTAVFAGYYHHWDANRTSRIPPVCWDAAEPVSQCNGARDAETDLADGRFVILSYGLPAPWSDEYAEILEADHGITIRTVGGCVVDGALMRYVAAYNNVMGPRILEAFGEDVFKRASEKARVRHEARRQAEIAAMTQK